MDQPILNFVTGTPDYPRARRMIEEIFDLPLGKREDEVRIRVYQALRHLFPKLESPDIAVEFPTGFGDADVLCRNLVVETKRKGRLAVQQQQSDPTSESPQGQLERYLNAVSSSPRLTDSDEMDWRGLVTDGHRWEFYRWYPTRAEGQRLDPDTPDAVLTIEHRSQIDALLIRLHDAVDRTSKIAPPTHDGRWATSKLESFVDLVARVKSSSSFEMKLALWQDMLDGAYINSPSSKPEILRLFASHTLLVLTARAVSDVIAPLPVSPEAKKDSDLSEIARGFPAWLVDAGAEAGAELIEGLKQDVGRYDWRRSEHDYLKDLYHTIIPTEVRHDFGEYYTPDWLARAVCEEVLDRSWREQVVDEVVAGVRSGPAILDPACGSGTFLYHATQMLLDTAGEHPDLRDSPLERAQVVNTLVAGMDLHPVAVELARTTKRLAFVGLGNLPDFGELNVYLGDSLKWSISRRAGESSDDLQISIPAGDEEPIILPRSLVLSDDFPQVVQHIFEKITLESDPNAETALLGVLGHRSKPENEAIRIAFRRFKEYHRTGRDHIWKWYIQNLAEPFRLSAGSITRLVGNPPWVVYNKIDVSSGRSRQKSLRFHARDRNLWAAGKLAPHNDLAAVFVATVVDEYLSQDQNGGGGGSDSSCLTQHCRRGSGRNSEPGIGHPRPQTRATSWICMVLRGTYPACMRRPSLTQHHPWYSGKRRPHAPARKAQGQWEQPCVALPKAWKAICLGGKSRFV